MHRDFRARIEKLCGYQGIKFFDKSGPSAGLETPEEFYNEVRGVHWAENIFSRPLSSRTQLRNLRPSRCVGPWSDVDPREVKILFQRSFDRGHLTISAFMDPASRSPYLVVRCLDTASRRRLFSIRGFHELCIERDGSCLVMKYQGPSKLFDRTWTVLCFRTYEGKNLIVFWLQFARNWPNTDNSLLP